MLGKAFRLMFLAALLGSGLSLFASAQVVWWSDHDITRGELRNFDGFLDSHPWIESDLNRNPGLAENPVYLAQHPEFRQFLANHPGVREELRENPRQFVRTEQRFDRREDRREWARNNWRDGDHDRDDWRWRERRGDWRDHDGDGWRDRHGDRD